MAKQTTSNPLSKYKSRVQKAHQQSAGKETDYSSNGELPSGINDGVAKLVDVKFGVYQSGDNKGETFFMARAVCVAPETYNGVKCVGKSTMIMEALCDTPRSKARPTLEDHIDWMYNELRKLGVDTEEIDPEDLEVVFKDLIEASLYISFETWGGGTYKDQQGVERKSSVRHNWNGLVDFDANESMDSGVEDDEPIEQKEEEQEEQEEQSSSDEMEVDELTELGAKSDEEDADAQIALTSRADAVGVDVTDAQYADWAAVAEAVRAAEAGDGQEEEASGSDNWEPAVGDLYLFKPPRARAAVKVKVTKVLKRAKTVDLTNEATGKTYIGIAWDSLEDDV